MVDTLILRDRPFYVCKYHRIKKSCIPWKGTRIISGDGYLKRKPSLSKLRDYINKHVDTGCSYIDTHYVFLNEIPTNYIKGICVDAPCQRLYERTYPGRVLFDDILAIFPKSVQSQLELKVFTQETDYKELLGPIAKRRVAIPRPMKRPMKENTQRAISVFPSPNIKKVKRK